MTRVDESEQGDIVGAVSNSFTDWLHQVHGETDYNVHLLKEMFPISRLKVPAFLGSFGRTATTIKVKWLLERNAIQIGNNWLTPPQIARAYVKFKQGNKRRRVTSAQYDSIIRPKYTAPLYANSGYYRNFIHLDLKAAYWTLVSRLGLDVDYFPNRWITSSGDCMDFTFADNKIARNCLVSVGVPTSPTFWDGQKIVMLPISNSLVNLMLYNTVQTVLNGIARDMLAIGAIYIHTDGYMVPMIHRRLANEIAEEWGMSLSVKGRGDAHIIHIGKYRIGNKATQHYHPDDKPLAFGNVMPVDTAWLRPRVGRLMNRKLT